MTQLQKDLGHTFKNPALLRNALTHSSFANEKRPGGGVSNERLEFLGDSVLGFLVADCLYGRFPNMAEGQMTRLRAELVCEQSLHEVALRLDLGGSLRLGKGESQTGGRARPSILADAVEAVIAALYLDGGIDVARRFVDEQILTGIDKAKQEPTSDYKTALQEAVQRQSGLELSYQQTGESGPDHDKRFTFTVLLSGKEVGAGEGRTKKEAEQDAARQALSKLGLLEGVGR